MLTLHSFWVYIHLQVKTISIADMKDLVIKQGKGEMGLGLIVSTLIVSTLISPTPSLVEHETSTAIFTDRVEMVRPLDTTVIAM